MKRALAPFAAVPAKTVELVEDSTASAPAVSSAVFKATPAAFAPE